MLNKSTLRVVWIIPNVFCYLMVIGVLIFIIANYEGLKEIGVIMYWILILIALLLVTVFGSFRIRYWIMRGDL